MASIDVFGKPLTNRYSGGQRGPPGIGFKLTAEGNFDLEERKLCNVGEPQQESDAVTLKSVRMTVEKALSSLYDIKNDGIAVKLLEDKLRKDLKDQMQNYEILYDLVIRNTKSINKLDTLITQNDKNDDNNALKGFEIQFKNSLTQQQQDRETILNLATTNATLIRQLDTRLAALEKWMKKQR